MEQLNEIFIKTTSEKTVVFMLQKTAGLILKSLNIIVALKIMIITVLCSILLVPLLAFMELGNIFKTF